MHRRLLAALSGLVFFAYATHAAASSSLRVGNRVLVVGDSAATVAELLGKPSYKSHRGGTGGNSRGGKRTRAVAAGTKTGEQWQYRQDGHVIVITLVDGRVSDIDERSR
ncbi:DUF2845 domain-containing protein [Rhodanobacter sp. DHG33]|uniref:DUF2845 domain-containing protein n=1 Tax=Rhodanobacter sp. DHG33 TaxID=2775921 RepID=UPI001783FBDF|nr:DUF2845 domain-containing protein [Rhodanobacter sp. DHG33]MBD8900493.1 DUF2845 domain-containing protein [Rhodanobacter sp. DHG33]